MRKTATFLAAVVISLTTAGAARAAASAKAVAPFLDEQTLAVLHIDLGRIKVNALARKLIEVGGLKQSEVAEPMREVGEAIDRFTRAGGKDLYLVFGLSDLTHRIPFLVVIPLAQDADVQALRELAGRPPMFAGATFKQVGRVLIGGSPRTLQRLRTLQPTADPELDRAFGAAGDSTAQLVLLLSADNRRVIRETLPELPPAVGGGPSTVITRGFRWSALGADLAPELSLRLVVQAHDAEAARQLEQLFGKALESVGRQKAVREVLPHLDTVLARLRPRTEQDRLTLTLNDRQLTALLKPMIPRVRQASARAQSTNNLKQLGLAMHNYHDTFRGFPKQAIYGKDGKPLLSWRVAILPFIEQDELYRQFHLDEPWDSEHNKKLIAQMPAVYASSPKLAAQHKTTYLAVVGERTVFPGNQTIGFKDVTDGTAGTILLVDANDDHGVIWARPDDLSFDVQDPVRALVGHFPGGFLSLFVDGSVHFIPAKIPAARLRALFTRNGNEEVDLSEY